MTTTTLRSPALRHRKTASLQSVKIHWKAMYLVAMASCALMLVFYIFEINQLTQGSYLIKNYNKEIKSLLTQNRDLQASFAEASVWGGIQNKAQSLDFQKTMDVTYVKVLQSSLAKAK